MSNEPEDFDVLASALIREKTRAEEGISQRLAYAGYKSENRSPRVAAREAIMHLQDACGYYDRVAAELERVERARVAAFNAESAASP
jgi:hypothetical protein